MHELSMAEGIISHVLAVAQEHGATRVSQVTVSVGAMQLVVPETLDLAFEAVAEGTLAQDAELQIIEEKMEATCNRCGHTFEPAIDCYLCPHCHQADARITAGNQIMLQAVVCDAPQETTVP